MRLRRCHLPFVALLGAVVAMLPSLAASATTADVSAESSLYLNKWSPGEVAVTPNGTVTFHNATGVNHGIVWDSVPATPACDNTVPVGSFSTSWNGNCAFAQSGVYAYHCSYHGLGMSGSVYVNAGGTLPPSGGTEAATAVSETGATLRGAINPNGQPTSYYFNYGASTAYGQKTEEASVGADSSPHALSAPITGLAAGTLYHFQIVATYGAGNVLGADRTFTTASPPGAPTASTGEATALSETGATLRGTVNPNGQETTYFFKYGTTSNYGLVTSTLPAGADSVNHTVSAVLSGLTSGTVYHFELIAHNSLGDAPGADETFTTASPPPPPPPGSTTTTTTTPPPIATVATSQPPPSSGGSLGASGGSPLAGSASTAIKVASTQHGSSVRGSLAISPAGAGTRLEVDLLASTASLARKHAKQVRIGRLLRSSLAAGKVSFSVSLNAKAKRALRRHKRLPVIVQITLTPTHGAPVATTRSIVLRG